MINEQSQLLCDDCLKVIDYCVVCKVCAQYVCLECSHHHITAMDNSGHCRYHDMPEYWRPVGCE
jgi:hypothetical protein